MPFLERTPKSLAIVLAIPFIALFVVLKAFPVLVILSIALVTELKLFGLSLSSASARLLIELASLSTWSLA